MQSPDFSNELQTAASLADFGEMFRRERKALGMSQSDVAKKASCRRQTIADIEAGKSVTTLTFFNAIQAIQKQIQLCSTGVDLENIRAFLGPDWEE